MTYDDSKYFRLVEINLVSFLVFFFNSVFFMQRAYDVIHGMLACKRKLKTIKQKNNVFVLNVTIHVYHSGYFIVLHNICVYIAHAFYRRSNNS